MEEKDIQNNDDRRQFLRHSAWLGIASVLFYFLHVIVGAALYDGYDPMTQAISDLTANGAPSELAARVLSGVYGVFNIAFLVGFYLFFRKKLNKIFDIAALLFLLMGTVSAVGYTAFPLSGAGSKNAFQDAMHIVVTALVVALSIAALALFAIGFIRAKHKLMGCLAIAALVLMALGSMLSGAVPAILGLAERISIYSLQVYSVCLSVFLYMQGKQK